MGISLSAKPRAWLPRPPHWAALVVMAMGFVGLFGWIYDMKALRELAFKGTAMKANMAVALVLCGLSLWLLTDTQYQKWVRWFALASAALALSIGALTLTEHVTGLDFGIDQLLFKERPGEPGTSSPNRLGPPGAIGLVLAGSCLLLLMVPARLSVLYQILAVILGLTASLGILGYAFGTETLYGIPNYTGIALPTSLALAVLAVGLLLARPKQGIAAMLFDAGIGGTAVRRLLPTAILAPLVLGWLHFQSEELELYDSAFGAAILALLLATTFSGLVFTHAAALARSEQHRRQTEDALRKNQAMLTRAQQVAKLGSWEWNIASGELNWSDETYRIFGFARGECHLSQEALLAAVGLEDREQIEGAIEEALAGWPYRVERKITHPDNSLHHILVHGEIVFDARGTALEIFGTVLDITEQKRAEEELRESESRYRILAENSADFIVLRELGGRILYRSPSYSRLLGWVYKETDATDDETEWRTRVHLDDWRSVERAMSAGQHGIRQTVTYRHRKSDGAYVWLESHVRPILDSRGKPQRLLIVSHDVSERKKAEEALAESVQRERERAEELAVLLDAVPTPVIIVHDCDALHMTGNRAADELLRNPRGGEASLSAPPETKPRHFRAVKDGRELRLDELPAQQAARGVVVRDFEFDLVFDDGTTRHVLAYGTPLRDAEGRARGAVHTLVDITDRERARTG